MITQLLATMNTNFQVHKVLTVMIPSKILLCMGESALLSFPPLQMWPVPKFDNLSAIFLHPPEYFMAERLFCRRCINILARMRENTASLYCMAWGVQGKPRLH
jgi:hypothetical protein